MRATLLLLLLVPDTSGASLDVVERRWGEKDWILANNDAIVVDERAGDVVALQIKGGGESALIRRTPHRLTFPTTIAWRIRWTEAAYGDAFPSVHVLFDLPEPKDDWWKGPLGPPGGGSWQKGVKSFLFHFSTNAGWRQYGICSNPESGTARHDFIPKKGEWIDLRVTLAKDKVTVFKGRDKICEGAADLSAFKTFHVAFGDQTSTRVELDELRVERR